MNGAQIALLILGLLMVGIRIYCHFRMVVIERKKDKVVVFAMYRMPKEEYDLGSPWLWDQWSCDGEKGICVCGLEIVLYPHPEVLDQIARMDR